MIFTFRHTPLRELLFTYTDLDKQAGVIWWIEIGQGERRALLPFDFRIVF